MSEIKHSGLFKVIMIKYVFTMERGRRAPQNFDSCTLFTITRVVFIREENLSLSTSTSEYNHSDDASGASIPFDGL